MTSTLVANSVTQSQENMEDISSNHYAVFKFSIRSEVTRKYYERRIRVFLDFIKFNFEDNNIDKRCNAFALKANHEIKWALEHVIRFLQFQKSRVENGRVWKKKCFHS
ncbi:MAG: hypothetical protein WBP64_04680 [Nitrososphaeraceae archaeon]